MNSSLDEVSRLLGNIEAELKATKEELLKLNARVREHQLYTVKATMRSKQVADRLDQIETTLAYDIQPTVNEVKKLKQRGMGVIAAVGFVSANVGAWGREALKIFGAE